MLKEPIDHVLIRNSLCTNRSVKNFLLKNEVHVNNVSIKEREYRIDAEKDEIIVNGTLLKKIQHKYIMFYKPLDYVCTRQEGNNKNIYDLLPKELTEMKNGLKLHSIGRLDKDSTGLLLLTTNGTFSHKLTSPDSNIQKTYEIKLQNQVDDSMIKTYIKAFHDGIKLEPLKHGEGFITKKAELIFKNNNECTVKLMEGKFRQIRRMFNALGNEVISLKRTKVGGLTLDERLNEGDFRFLDSEEVACIFNEY